MSDSQSLTIVGYSAEAWHSASPQLRVVAPAKHAEMRFVSGAEWQGNNLRIFPERVTDADLVVLQRDFPRWQEGYRKVTEQARALGKPVVFELDDLLTELPAGHPDYQHYKAARPLMLIAAHEADAVTVTTPALRDHLGHFNPNIYVLPNYLDDQVWSLGEGLSRQDPKVVIGFAGSRSHLHDLLFIEPVLLRLLQRYGDNLSVQFWGKAEVSQRLLEQPGVTWDKAHDLDYARFASRFSHAQIDIAVAPLVDNPFNNAKSYIKYLEYGALGIPGVYSACDSYRAIVDGENGFLAASIEEWEATLVRLIESEPLRRDIGRRALSTVRRHLLSDHAHRWRDVYSEVIEVASKGRALRAGQRESTGSDRTPATRDEVLKELLYDNVRVQVENLRLEAQLNDARTRIAATEGLVDTVTARLNKTEENVRWLESELQQTRGAITWRATEPIRKLYAIAQRRRPGAVTASGGETSASERQQQAAPGGQNGAGSPEADLPPAAQYKAEDFFWSEGTLAQVTPLPVSPVTDVIICIGKSSAMAEKCVRSIQQHTDPTAYRLKLVVHHEDLLHLPDWLASAGEVITHTLDIFNFAIANNQALRQCDGDVVLLNDDTEVTAGWLTRLREDSRGVALTGARTARQCSGNPDMWEPGPSRVTWYPVNMFCAFIPRRLREVVGLLEEEFFYYGGEDVDYSCRALQHGFPLVVSSAFVHHAGNQTFKGRKERLMQESDKILLERHQLTPPFALHAVKPRVSVITATHNRAGLLPQAVRSVLAGSYPEIETIIVDDASSDETPRVVLNLQQEDHRITSVRLTKNAGSCGARHAGLRASSGNFVALMDDDDTAWPDRILAPLQHLMTHPDLDVAYCNFDVVTETGRQRGNVKPFDLQEYLDMKFDIGSGVLLLRRRALVEVPFMRYYERAIDYDWVFRLVRRGYKLDYCPAVVLDYNRHGPAETHLAGNEAAIKQHKMIQDREQLVNQMRRR